MKVPIKVLNLYAGIGGNRRLWKNVEVTAVEHMARIANIYQNLYPGDIVIHGDAHQYLLDHMHEFDFIWSSPPCPTHSRLIYGQVEKMQANRYPDMALYQEIILLKHFFKGKYAVENVIGYYEPLIKPQISNNHYIWANFNIPNAVRDVRAITAATKKNYSEDYGEKRNKVNLDKFHLKSEFKTKILNNCVKPEVGLEILEAAFKVKQETLF